MTWDCEADVDGVDIEFVLESAAYVLACNDSSQAVCLDEELEYHVNSTRMGVLYAYISAGFLEVDAFIFHFPSHRISTSS